MAFLRCRSDPVTFLLQALHCSQDKIQRLRWTARSSLAPSPLPSWLLISTWILWTPPHCISLSYLLDHWPTELFLTLATLALNLFSKDSFLLENLFQTSPNRASLVAQLVKNPPAMWETWVWSLGWEDPLEKGMPTHSRILAWRIPRGHKESDTTEQLSLFKPLRLDCVPLPDPYFPSDTHHISCNCFSQNQHFFNYRKFKCKKKRENFPITQLQLSMHMDLVSPELPTTSLLLLSK